MIKSFSSDLKTIDRPVQKHLCEFKWLKKSHKQSIAWARTTGRLRPQSASFWSGRRQACQAMTASQSNGFTPERLGVISNLTIRFNGLTIHPFTNHEQSHL